MYCGLHSKGSANQKRSSPICPDIGHGESMTNLALSMRSWEMMRSWWPAVTTTASRLVSANSAASRKYREIARNRIFYRFPPWLPLTTLVAFVTFELQIKNLLVLMNGEEAQDESRDNAAHPAVDC